VLWLPAPKGRGYLSMANAANFATLILLSASSAVCVTAGAGLFADVLFRKRKWYQGTLQLRGLRRDRDGRLGGLPLAWAERARTSTRSSRP
jgi:hypothetical protein